jgi:hypothetical protein
VALAAGSVTATSTKDRPLAVPAQNRVWLHQQHGVAPSGHQPSEQDKQAAFVWPEGGTLDPTRDDDQLLAEKGVLGDQLPAGPGQVHDEPGPERQRARGLAQGGLDAFHRCGGRGSEVASEARQHGRRSGRRPHESQACGIGNPERSCGGRDEQPAQAT